MFDKKNNWSQKAAKKVFLLVGRPRRVGGGLKVKAGPLREKKLNIGLSGRRALYQYIVCIGQDMIPPCACILWN